MSFINWDKTTRKVTTIDRFARETGVTRVNAGSTTRALIDPIHAELDAIENRIDEAMNQALPLSASGPYLTLWQDFLGVDTPPPTRAYARAEEQVVKLYMSKGKFGDLTPSGGDVLLSKQTFSMFGKTQQVSHTELFELPVEYGLLEDVTLPAASSELYIGVIAIQAGDLYNLDVGMLDDHNYKDYPSFPEKKLLITNLMPIMTGTPLVDEESVRYEISRTSISRPNNSVDKLSAMAGKVPGVSNVIVVPYISGSGTVDIYIDSPVFNIPIALIENVRSAIEQVAFRGLQVFVRPMKRVGLSIKSGVLFKPRTPAESKAEFIRMAELESLLRIINSQPGQPFDLAELYYDLLRSSAIVSEIGTKAGFSEVIIYREGLNSKRVGQILDNPLKVVQIPIYTKLLPENNLTKPVYFYER
jgi:hypothetical protein